MKSNSCDRDSAAYVSVKLQCRQLATGNDSKDGRSRESRLFEHVEMQRNTVDWIAHHPFLSMAEKRTDSPTLIDGGRGET